MYVFMTGCNILLRKPTENGYGKSTACVPDQCSPLPHCEFIIHGILQLVAVNSYNMFEWQYACNEMINYIQGFREICWYTLQYVGNLWRIIMSQRIHIYYHKHTKQGCKTGSPPQLQSVLKSHTIVSLFNICTRLVIKIYSTGNYSLE